MDDAELTEVVRLMREAVENQRGYADFFGWPDRQAMERGIVLAFKETLLRHGEPTFTEIWSRNPGEDPPDCEARDTRGRSIGIEVTELVDEDSIKDRKKKFQDAWANWARPRLIAELASRISKKDAPSKLTGGPYDSYLLIIHCDEPGLDVDVVTEMLGDHTFDPTTLIHAAYLLLSFDPRTKECPVIRLRVEKAL